MSKHFINNKEIAVVVQGGCKGTTKKCLKNIREKLPGSYIILSTWIGENITSLTYDEVIFNVDPGAILHIDRPYNINRMITSTKAGIKKACLLNNIKYILKLRTDMYIKHTGFLKYFYKFPKRDREFSLFKQRIIAYPAYSLCVDVRNKTKEMPTPFHVSDWCYFGLKEDLAELYNVPLVKEPGFTKYFDTHLKNGTDIFPERTWCMPPEQYVTSLNAKKKFDFQFNSYVENNEKNIKISQGFVFDNFIFLDVGQHGCLNIDKNYLIFLMKNYSYNQYCSYSLFIKLYYKNSSFLIKFYQNIKGFLSRLYHWHIFYRLLKCSKRIV